MAQVKGLLQAGCTSRTQEFTGSTQQTGKKGSQGYEPGSCAHLNTWNPFWRWIKTPWWVWVQHLCLFKGLSKPPGLLPNKVMTFAIGLTVKLLKTNQITANTHTLNITQQTAFSPEPLKSRNISIWAQHFMTFLGFPCPAWLGAASPWVKPERWALPPPAETATKTGKKNPNKSHKRQHVPSRRVCYANESVVSLTQEKQLLPLPFFLTGLKPSGIFATTRAKKVSAHHVKSFGKCEAHEPLCEQEQSPVPAMATLWEQQQQRADEMKRSSGCLCWQSLQTLMENFSSDCIQPRTSY